MTEISFNGGRFVSNREELNYEEVLNHFPCASIIRILTYNISRNQQDDKLLNALKETNADVQIITNVPSRMERYYNSDAGNHMRMTARRNINVYISKLNPENFQNGFVPFFNVHNHAKIIGTEDIVYIGSANFSNESANNIETGVIIEDKVFIQKLYSEFFDVVKNESLSYYDESFSAFSLFVLSLYAKFEHHYNKIITNVYTDYERTKLVVAETIFISVDELDALYRDLEELEGLCNIAEETYDEENDGYNEELDDLKEELQALNIEWLEEVVSEDGDLYKLASFDSDVEVGEIMQSDYSQCAFDDQLDYYTQKAMDRVQAVYEDLHDTFFDQGDDFLNEMQAILRALEKAMSFSKKWKASKINPEIDNT